MVKFKKMLKKIFRTKKRIVLCCISIVVVLAIVMGIFIWNKNSLKNPNICIVQFESNGGSEILSQDIVCGKYAKEPNIPEKEGFIFLGWMYEGQNFDFKSKKVKSNIILIANWQVQEGVDTVTIHFDTDGGSFVNDITIAKGTLLTPPINPLKEGYEFNGWYQDDIRFDFMNSINLDLTLKAKWNIKEDITSDSVDKDNHANISIDKKCQYEMKDGSMPTAQFELGNSTRIASYWGFWNYTQDTCKIIYKSDNENILKVSSEGIATGIKAGKTNLYICIIDKSSNQELDCFKWYTEVIYTNESDVALKDSQALLNAIDGYYWYLDGYSYAYLYPNVISWGDHKILNWESEYLELNNNQIITTEDTGTVYTNSSNIHNAFLVNPIEFGYELIEKYNMHVSNNKLYISIGEKNYVFSKYTSKKQITTNIQLNSTNIVTDNYQSIVFNATISPAFTSHHLTVSSSDLSVVNDCSIGAVNSSGIAKITCYANNSGNSTITITDSISGVSKTIKITVNNVIVHVKGISLNKTKMNLLRGNSETLIPTIFPNNADNKELIWSSDHMNVATVSSSGKVTAIGKGSAKITVETVDGSYSATCFISVSNPQLTATASIGYSTIASNSSIKSGIKVDVFAKGGTGIYNYYDIKLYKDETLIQQTTNTSLDHIFIEGYKNGTYYAEFVVKDTDGNEYSGVTGKTTISR